MGPCYAYGPVPNDGETAYAFSEDRARARPPRRAARAVRARIDNSKAAAGVHSLRSVVYWPPGDHVCRVNVGHRSPLSSGGQAALRVQRFSWRLISGHQPITAAVSIKIGTCLLNNIVSPSQLLMCVIDERVVKFTEIQC